MSTSVKTVAERLAELKVAIEGIRARGYILVGDRDRIGGIKEQISNFKEIVREDPSKKSYKQLGNILDRINNVLIADLHEVEVASIEELFKNLNKLFGQMFKFNIDEDVNKACLDCEKILHLIEVRENTLDKIYALKIDNLRAEEMDLLEAGFKKLNALLTATSLDAEKIEEQCTYLNNRVLITAELSEAQVAKWNAEQLRVQCIKLIQNLKDPNNITRVPADFDILSLESLLQICDSIAANREEHLYVRVQNLVCALNELSSYRNYDKPKYDSFKEFLSTMGITYENKKFSCKDKNRVIKALQHRDSIEYSLLPEASTYILNPARDEAENSLQEAWQFFNEMHVDYKLLDTTLAHSGSLLERIRDICKNKLSAKEKLTETETRVLDLLNLQLALERRILPSHPEMKDKFHKNTLTLLVELETILVKTVDATTAKELKILCDKLEKAIVPISENLLSLEQGTIEREEGLLEDFQQRKEAAKEIPEEINQLEIKLAGFEKDLEEKRVDQDCSLTFRDQKQQRINEKNTELEEEREKNASNLKMQGQKVAEVASLSAQRQDEQDKVTAAELATQAAMQSQTQAETELEEVTHNLKELLDFEISIKQELAEKEVLVAARSKDLVSRPMDYDQVEHKIDLETVNSIIFSDENFSTSYLDTMINPLQKNSGSDSIKMQKNFGGKAYSDFSGASGDLGKIVTAEESIWNNPLNLNSTEEELKKKLEEVGAVYERLNTQLIEHKSTAREQVLRKLKRDLLTDINAFTTRHTHLAKEATGFGSMISRLFRTETTKALAKSLTDLKAKLEDRNSNENEILSCIEEFQELMASKEFQRSGSTTEESEFESREFDMQALYYRWREEGKTAVDVCVGDKVKPITDAIQRCNEIRKPMLDELHQIKFEKVEKLKSDVNGLKEAHESAKKEMSKKDAARVALVEEIRLLTQETESFKIEDAERTKEIEVLKGELNKHQKEADDLQPSINKAEKDIKKYSVEIELKEAEFNFIVKQEENMAERKAAIDVRKEKFTEVNNMKNKLGFSSLEPAKPVVAQIQQNITSTIGESDLPEAAESLANWLGEDLNDAESAQNAEVSGDVQKLVDMPRRAIADIQRHIAEVEEEIAKYDGEGLQADISSLENANKLHARSMLNVLNKISQIDKDKLSKKQSDILNLLGKRFIDSLNKCVNEGNFEEFIKLFSHMDSRLKDYSDKNPDVKVFVNKLLGELLDKNDYCAKIESNNLELINLEAKLTEKGSESNKSIIVDLRAELVAVQAELAEAQAELAKPKNVGFSPSAVRAKEQNKSQNSNSEIVQLQERNKGFMGQISTNIMMLQNGDSIEFQDRLDFWSERLDACKEDHVQYLGALMQIKEELSREFPQYMIGAPKEEKTKGGFITSSLSSLSSFFSTPAIGLGAAAKSLGDIRQSQNVLQIQEFVKALDDCIAGITVNNKQLAQLQLPSANEQQSQLLRSHKESVLPPPGNSEFSKEGREYAASSVVMHTGLGEPGFFNGVRVDTSSNNQMEGKVLQK